MRRRVRNALIAACLVMIAGAAPSEAAATRSSSPPALDGEEIFRGVYFGEGRAARLLQGTTWATPESRAISDQVIERIRTSSPSFLPAFAEDMTSGNHLVIASALDRADEQLQSAIDQLDMAASPYAKGSFIVTSKVIIYADTGTVWAPGLQGGRLAKEQLVDRAAEELKR